jgi:hypothetical protein
VEAALHRAKPATSGTLTNSDHGSWRTNGTVHGACRAALAARGSRALPEGRARDQRQVGAGAARAGAAWPAWRAAREAPVDLWAAAAREAARQALLRRARAAVPPLRRGGLAQARGAHGRGAAVAAGDALGQRCLSARLRVDACAGAPVRLPWPRARRRPAGHHPVLRAARGPDRVARGRQPRPRGPATAGPSARSSAPDGASGGGAPRRRPATGAPTSAARQAPAAARGPSR